MSEQLPKVFAFINSGKGTDWVCGMAIAEDGHCLATHISSIDAWARHDMGAGVSTSHHDTYAKHYPSGFVVEWVDDPKAHAGLMEAYRLNQEMAKAQQPGGQP